MSGPVFLLVYLALLVVAFVSSRIFQRKIWDRPEADPIQELAPMELAYLVGGQKQAMLAALAALAQSSQVRVDFTTTPKIFRQGGGPAGLQDPVVDAVYNASTGEGVSLSELSRAADAPLKKVQQKLEGLGLFASGAQKDKLLQITLMAFAPVGALGFARFLQGVTRGKPVGYLFMLMLIGLLAIWMALRLAPRRTPQGDQLLTNLREQNAALETTARAKLDQLGATEIAIAVALFGSAVLLGSSLDALTKSFSPLTADGGGSGCGSSCGGGSSCSGGSSGCGSSGCGGGCGGCGGCGG